MASKLAVHFRGECVNDAANTRGFERGCNVRGEALSESIHKLRAGFQQDQRVLAPEHLIEDVGANIACLESAVHVGQEPVPLASGLAITPELTVVWP